MHLAVLDDPAGLYGMTLGAHRSCAALSVALFAARGWGVQRGHAWPLQAPARRGSVVIDATLLALGLALWVALAHNPLREPWLAVKLLLLPVYVVLGSLALKRARTRHARRACLLAALACVGQMASMAWFRSPWGFLSPIMVG